MTTRQDSQPLTHLAARTLPLSLVQAFLLGLVLLLGAGIRIYDLTDPPLDFYSTRQLRSAIIARGLYYGIDNSADPALRVQAASIANSMEAYEPPIFEGLVALSYRLAGQEILWVSRLWSALFWSIGGLALFAIARRFASFYAALVGLMFYLFLPFAIIASRSFQPDPFMVMWMILAWWAMLHWLETPRWKWALLAGVFAGTAILVKAVAAFPVVVALAVLLLVEWGFKKTLRSQQVWSLGALMAVPSFAYYVLSLGPRSSSFLSFWTVSLSRLVLTSRFYAQWLGMLHGLMGLTTILLALVGVLLAARPTRSLLLGGWLGYGLYGLMFPYQMTTHEYYHIQLVPLVALSLVPLVEVVFRVLSGQRWHWRAAAAALLVFSAGYNLYAARSTLYARSYRNEATAWQRMGQALPANGRMIALISDYGNRLKYYGWRSIAAYWPSQADMNLSQLAGNDKMEVASYFQQATQGMDYFLVTSFGELDQQPELKQILTTQYPLKLQGDGFALYDLRQQVNP